MNKHEAQQFFLHVLCSHWKTGDVKAIQMTRLLNPLQSASNPQKLAVMRCRTSRRAFTKHVCVRILEKPELLRRNCFIAEL